MKFIPYADLTKIAGSLAILSEVVLVVRIVTEVIEVVTILGDVLTIRWRVWSIAKATSFCAILLHVRLIFSIITITFPSPITTATITLNVLTGTTRVHKPQKSDPPNQHQHLQATLPVNVQRQ